MVTAVLKDRTSTMTSAAPGPPTACAPGRPQSKRTPARDCLAHPSTCAASSTVAPGQVRERALEGGLVAGDPVQLQPEHGAGPGAGDLQDADGDQHRPADQAERPGVPPREVE